MIRGIFKFDGKVKYFLLTTIGVYFTVFVASVFGKIIFLTKYLTEIYPALILLMVTGFSCFKNKSGKIVLSTIYVCLSLFYITVSSYSPVRLVREEGQNIPVIMLNILDAKETDKILFLYYPKERFAKYSKNLSEGVNTFDISKYNFTIINKTETAQEVYKKRENEYKEIFTSKKNKNLDAFLDKNIFSKIKKGERFFLVDFSPVTFFNSTELKNIAQDDAKFKKVPFLYLVFSYIKNYVTEQANTLLSFKDVKDGYAWRIYIFEKT